MPLSHLLSRKEKVIRAIWGLGWLIVDSALLRQRGQLIGASTRRCQPHPAPDGPGTKKRMLCVHKWACMSA